MPVYIKDSQPITDTTRSLAEKEIMEEKNGLPPPLYPATPLHYPIQHQRPRSAKRKDIYRAKSATAIGSLQIVGGILITLFCIGVAVPMLGTEMESYEHSRIIPYGMGLMIFLAITGGIGIGAAKKKTRCLIIAHMVLCIIVSISLGCLLMQVIGIMIEHRMNEHDRDGHSGPRMEHSGFRGEHSGSRGEHIRPDYEWMASHEEPPEDYMMGERRDEFREGGRRGRHGDRMGDGLHDTMRDIDGRRRDRDDMGDDKKKEDRTGELPDGHRDGRPRDGDGMGHGDGSGDKKEDGIDREGKPMDGKPPRGDRDGLGRDPAEYPDDALFDLMDTDESGDNEMRSEEYDYETTCWIKGYSHGSRRKISVAMSWIVLVLVLFEFIVTVWGSALACRVKCCAPRSGPVSPSLIYAQSQPPLPVVDVDGKAPVSAEYGGAPVVVPLTKEQEALGLDPRLLEPNSPPPPY